MKQSFIKRMALALMVVAALTLTSCSRERRQVTKYLDGLSQATQPAVQQGQVVSELFKNTRVDNFVATWPVLRKNIDELKTTVAAADQAIKQLPVPSSASTVNQLVTEDMGVLRDLSTKGLDLGDQLSNLGTGFSAWRKWRDLKPAIDDVKLLGARQTELGIKIRTEIANLKQTEKIP